MMDRFLLRTVTDTAMGLPSVTKTFPFGPDYDVIKVVGRVFAMLTVVCGIDIVRPVLSDDPGSQQPWRTD